MKRELIAAALAVGTGACVVGAPPGFSDGQSWSFPLVGPLEDGELLTPVMVNDHGPYLFAIDPDAPISSIDDGIVSEIQPYGGLAARYADEQDTTHQTRSAEISTFKIGTLSVRHRTVWVQHVGTFQYGGRQIRGVLGRDVIADSIVFGFDRDKGMGYLATRKGFTAPQGAATIGFSTLTNHMAVDLRPPARRVATAKIGAATYRLHLDLGGDYSQIRQQKWAEAKLATVPQQITLTDEIGTRRNIDQGGLAGQVVAGGASAAIVLFVPYDDRRFEPEDVDGTLGLNFFRAYNVYADWDKTSFYVVPRNPDLGANVKDRIDRWGSSVLSSCAHTACVDVGFLGEEAPPPTPPPAPADGAMGAPAIPPPAKQAPLLHLARDPAAAELNLEVVIQAVGPGGKPLDQPLLVANLPKGVNDLTQRLDPSYADATLRVVDASPFVRACQGSGGCMYQMSPTH